MVPCDLIRLPRPVDRHSWEVALEDRLQTRMAVDDRVLTIGDEVRQAGGEHDLITHTLFAPRHRTAVALTVPHAHLVPFLVGPLLHLALAFQVPRPATLPIPLFQVADRTVPKCLAHARLKLQRLVRPFDHLPRLALVDVTGSHGV